MNGRLNEKKYKILYTSKQILFKMNIKVIIPSS